MGALSEGVEGWGCRGMASRVGRRGMETSRGGGVEGWGRRGMGTSGDASRGGFSRKHQASETWV